MFIDFLLHASIVLGSFVVAWNTFVLLAPRDDRGRILARIDR